MFPKARMHLFATTSTTPVARPHEPPPPPGGEADSAACGAILTASRGCCKLLNSTALFGSISNNNVTKTALGEAHLMNLISDSSCSCGTTQVSLCRWCSTDAMLVGPAATHELRTCAANTLRGSAAERLGYTAPACSHVSIQGP
jgi:hypothetical protein